MINRIGLLLGMALTGMLTGFVLGVLWTTNQALGTKDQNPALAIQAAENEIHKLGDQLQQAKEQITQIAAERDYYKNLPAPTLAKTAATTKPTSKPVAYYSGEDLLQAVNKYRREHGVPELQLHSGLCQLSSRRLGELINLGKLDNHAGFEKYFNENKISEMAGPQLTNVAENLASGYATAWEAVMGWDSSPPHRTFLLADGSYKYGCASANYNFAVLIAGF